MTEDKGEFSSFFNYLQSQQGHEIASRIVTLFEEVKKATLDKSVEQSKLNIGLTHRVRKYLIILRGSVFAIVIIAASVLTYLGKFDSTLAVLFGTLVGYFFGKKTQ